MSTRTVRWLTEEQTRQRAALAESGRTREPVRCEVDDDGLVPDGELEASVNGRTAVLRLYDVIDSWGGWWGLSAGEVADALDELDDDVTTLEVHLNSPGGEATEGVALANVLRQHPARVVAVVDGLCASAATMVLTAADESIVAPGSQVMVHEASGGAWGDAAYLEQYARSLNSISAAYAAAYAARAGGTAEEWRAVMRDETWFSPDEAVASGLADRLLEQPSTDEPAAAVARHDLRVFAHAGRAAAPAPRLPVARRAPGAPAAAGGTSRKEPDAMSDAIIQGLRERLGFAEGADEATILAAVDEALAEGADPAGVPTTSLPDGVVAIDAAQLTELRAAAQAGHEARAQQMTERRERLVNEAVADGRIAPARRDAWLQQLTADPGAEQVLAGLEKCLVPLAEIGHELDDTDTGDVLRAELEAAGLTSLIVPTREKGA